VKLGLASCSFCLAFVALALGLGGCTGSTPDGASDSGAGGNDGAAAASRSGTGDPDVLVGTFQVKLTPTTSSTAATTAVVGKVFDGPTPSIVVWEKPQQEGDCVLTTPRVPYCSTPCGGSAACAEDDTCLDYPTARGVGVVTVDGLHTSSGAKRFTMKPVANAYQPPAGTALAYPPFDEGEAVTFTAAGDYFSGFELLSTGVAPLVLTSTELALKRDAPLTLTWEPGGSSAASIHVKLDISHHGGTKGQILCDAQDSGELTVSEALITRLIDLGVAGYPSVIVTRHATGSAVIAAGRVDLDIASVVEQSISVEGLVSCAADRDCADGQTCQPDLTCE